MYMLEETANVGLRARSLNPEEGPGFPSLSWSWWADLEDGVNCF